MTGTDYTMFTQKSVTVIFEPPCISFSLKSIYFWSFPVMVL
jgi:hypothetical protein